MLFVRTEAILQTMIKAPLILAGLIVVAVVMPLQYSFSSTRGLDLIVYSDGSTHVFSEIEVDPLQTDFEVKLFGTEIDNFVAVGENDFLLSGEITGDTALVETFGSSTISINYDSHDLVSKEGRIWTFDIDSPSEFSLLMPQNSVIVGMSNFPSSMEIIDEQSQLILPSGQTQIDYIFGASTPDPTPITPTPNLSGNGNSFDSAMIAIGSAIVAAGIGGAIMIRKSKRKTSMSQITKPESVIESKLQTEAPLNAETIFKLRPDLREDDKEIIKFIFENGGEAKESELRKKFLQPRTTMWRAVKRLERQGIIEIEKKELQNLVRLTKKLEEEE
jgi:uncharacterized membrane protein